MQGIYYVQRGRENATQAGLATGGCDILRVCRRREYAVLVRVRRGLLICQGATDSNFVASFPWSQHSYIPD